MIKFPRASRIIPPVFLLVAGAVSAHAQISGASGSPFDQTLNSLVAFATGSFARIVSILAVIFGGWQFISGDGHGKRVVGGMLVGIGMMVWAPQLIQWLFPGA